MAKWTMRACGMGAVLAAIGCAGGRAPSESVGRAAAALTSDDWSHIGCTSGTIDGVSQVTCTRIDSSVDVPKYIELVAVDDSGNYVKAEASLASVTKTTATWVGKLDGYCDPDATQDAGTIKPEIKSNPPWCTYSVVGIYAL